MDKPIGMLLRERRKELKLTLKQIAAACNVTESTVSRWETGNIDNMKRGTIYLLSIALYLPVETILGVETDKKIIPANLINKRRSILEKLNKCSMEQLNQVDKFIDTFILDDKGKSNTT